MNAVAYAEVARITRAHINARLNERREALLRIRTELKAIARQSGRFSAREMQDLVCTLAECAGDDIREIKGDLTEVSITLDGHIHYGSDE